MEETVREALKVIFEALKTGKVERFAQFIAPEVVWEVPGRSIFSGEYRGPDGCARLILQRRELAGNSLRPFGDDIGITPHHGVLMYAVRAERNGRQHLSHEIMVAGYGPNGIEAIHHYIYELYEFDEFWSEP